MLALFVLLGGLFGFVLSRSGCADYGFVQGMFLCTNVQMYLIIGTAVAITAPGLYLLKRFGRTVTGEPIRIELKPRHRGNVVGGILFGIGWSITGMCPGPILVNIGEGKLYALAALAGALAGAAIFGVGYPTFARLFGLPAAQRP